MLLFFNKIDEFVITIEVIHRFSCFYNILTNLTTLYNYKQNSTNLVDIFKVSTRN